MATAGRGTGKGLILTALLSRTCSSSASPTNCPRNLGAPVLLEHSEGRAASQVRYLLSHHLTHRPPFPLGNAPGYKQHQVYRLFFHVTVPSREISNALQDIIREEWYQCEPVRSGTEGSVFFWVLRNGTLVSFRFHFGPSQNMADCIQVNMTEACWQNVTYDYNGWMLNNR